jgi:hypothetical protein
LKPIPVPDQFKNAKEGAVFNKDGVNWFKRGDQLVPQGQ